MYFLRVQILPLTLVLLCWGPVACQDESSEPPSSAEAAVTKQPANSQADSHQDTAVNTSDHKPNQHKPNRLIHEKSPYLLQHAYNPVDWYPWGEEAFEKARLENKPIFLSIGYSTCHWCHVMERESFETDRVADVLNEHFVAIKVDREERPDLDQVYMSFVQATTGRGGWPMSVWLTPDRKPFFGGTYFPPTRRGNQPGFIELLTVLSQRWESNHDEILESADKVLEQLRERNNLRGRGESTDLKEEFLTAAYKELKSRFDDQYGGFGGAPKFPTPSQLLFLHRSYLRNQEPEALEMSVQTLLAMNSGGIHDHLGGGFHRYSTDNTWRLPHFEKMLYDQAQLVVAYIEAYQLTGNDQLARTARDICDYVLRDLADPLGGFYSAEDADSVLDPKNPEEKLEGAFYVWRYAELQELLDAQGLDLVTRYYGALPQGNLNNNELRGYNVLYVDQPLSEIADSLSISATEANERLQQVHTTLLKARKLKVRPHLDDKILTAWNGLMISALAQASRALDSEEYLTAALRATDFVLAKLWDEKNQRLLRRYRDGESKINAFNSDYASFVQGLLDVYEASGMFKYLEWAIRLTDQQIQLFGDPKDGGFFEVTDEDSTVLLRSKDDFDGAQPTSNSTTALNLLRLAEMQDSTIYRAQARLTLELFAPSLERFGVGLTAMMVALDFELAAPRQVILAGRPGAEDTQVLLQRIHKQFLPHTVVLFADGGEAQKTLAKSLPIMDSIVMLQDKATAYVCQNYTCQLPVTDPSQLDAQLQLK